MSHLQSLAFVSFKMNPPKTKHLTSVSDAILSSHPLTHWFPVCLTPNKLPLISVNMSCWWCKCAQFLCLKNGESRAACKFDAQLQTVLTTPVLSNVYFMEIKLKRKTFNQHEQIGSAVINCNYWMHWLPAATVRQHTVTPQIKLFTFLFMHSVWTWEL